eukprot:2872824-Lingulodinium_polyedra.AAC.1
MTPRQVVKSYCHHACQPVVNRNAGASEGSWHIRHLPLSPPRSTLLTPLPRRCALGAHTAL